ncbi:MAG: hypothetical protein ACYCO0_03930 [Candidatus Micrarchaeaceae archaeon]
MRVTKWVDGGLILEGNIDAGIQEAFDEKRYVEAFALLHGRLDFLMHTIYQNYEVSKGRRGTDLGALINENVSWKMSLARLSKNQIINEKERQRLINFNDLRNRIIHRLIVRSYQPSRPDKLTQIEVDTGFEEGKRLVKLLDEKTGWVLNLK